MRSSRFFTVLCCALTFSVASGREASAEFLRTNWALYQGSDLRSKVIISRIEPGILVASGPETPLQKFDPDKLQRPTTSHCFIKFDPKGNRYSTLLVGSKEYRINGNVSLTVGELRVTIDNHNPYLSIIMNSKSEADGRPGILGFAGVEPVINAVGEEAVALLEANKFSRYSTLVKPYDITPRGLMLDNEPVTTGFVGVDLDSPPSPCEAKEAIVMSREKLGIPENASPEEREKALVAIAEKQKPGKNPIGQWLKLRTSEESMIAFDFESTSVKVVHRVKLPKPPNFICIVDTRDVGL